MRARCAASVLLVALGTATAVAVTGAHADDPAPPATVTVVTTVDRTVDGWPASRWAARSRAWHRRFVQADRNSRARGRTVRRLRHAQTRTWRPTVDYALRLTSVVYGVAYSKLRAVAWCESRLNPLAVNGQYRNLFQEGPMFERGPFGRAGFSVWDPVAAAMTAGWTVAHDGSWRQWTCGGA